MSFTSIALVGPGGLGSIVLAELLRRESLKFTVLARTERSVPTGATLKLVDFGSADSLEAALAGIDVVISTLGATGIETQSNIARAAKHAGVQLFVPSEFGPPTDGKTDDPVLGPKARLQEYLKSIQLPSLLVYCGQFTDVILNPDSLAGPFGFHWREGTIKIIGDGNSPISFTSREDVGRFLVHALATFPRSALTNGTLRIEGDRKSLNEAVATFQFTHPSQHLAVSHESLTDAEALVAKSQGSNLEGVISSILVSWAHGQTVNTGGDALSNGMWPAWEPKSVEDIMKTF